MVPAIFAAFLRPFATVGHRTHWPLGAFRAQVLAVVARAQRAAPRVPLTTVSRALPCCGLAVPPSLVALPAQALRVSIGAAAEVTAYERAVAAPVAAGKFHVPPAARGWNRTPPPTLHTPPAHTHFTRHRHSFFVRWSAGRGGRGGGGIKQNEGAGAKKNTGGEKQTGENLRLTHGGERPALPPHRDKKTPPKKHNTAFFFPSFFLSFFVRLLPTAHHKQTKKTNFGAPVWFCACVCVCV